MPRRLLPSTKPSTTSTSAAASPDSNKAPYRNRMSKRRIVVTGLGVVSPVGSTVKAAWDTILRGESGIGPVTRFDVSAFPVRIGGGVREFDVKQYIQPENAPRRDDVSR